MIMVGLFGFCSVGVFGLGHNFCDLSSRTDDRHRPPIPSSVAEQTWQYWLLYLLDFLKMQGVAPHRSKACRVLRNKYMKIHLNFEFLIFGWPACCRHLIQFIQGVRRYHIVQHPTPTPPPPVVVNGDAGSQLRLIALTSRTLHYWQPQCRPRRRHRRFLCQAWLMMTTKITVPTPNIFSKSVFSA